jgi:hypothetical protein
LVLQHEDRQAVFAEWERYVENTPPPKLLVWLQESTAWMQTGIPGDQQSIDVGRTSLAGSDVWSEILERFYQGPLLKLAASQSEWSLTELTAAIEAMK